MIRQLAGVARLEFLRLLRSPMALALLLVVPAFQVILFGYAIRPGAEDFAVAISAPSLAQANDLADRLARDGALRVVERQATPAQARQAVASGRALIGIDFPQQRSFDHPDLPTLPVRVSIDGANAPLARSALARIEAIYWRSRAERDRYADLRAPLRVEVLANPALRDAWSFLPALSGVVVMIATVMLGCLGVAREREGGTWDLLATMPLSRLTLTLGKLLPGMALGTAQGCVMLMLGHVLFAMPLSIRAFLLVAALLPGVAAAHMALGLAISARAANQISALQGAVAFYLPAMLLSGFLYPLETLPHWARVLASVFPLTHYIRAARAAVLNGRGWDAATVQDAFAIVAFLVLAVAAASLVPRRLRAQRL